MVRTSSPESFWNQSNWTNSCSNSGERPLYEWEKQEKRENRFNLAPLQITQSDTNTDASISTQCQFNSTINAIDYTISQLPISGERRYEFNTYLTPNFQEYNSVYEEQHTLAAASTHYLQNLENQNSLYDCTLAGHNQATYTSQVQFPPYNPYEDNRQDTISNNNRSPSLCDSFENYSTQSSNNDNSSVYSEHDNMSSRHSSISEADSGFSPAISPVPMQHTHFLQTQSGTKAKLACFVMDLCFKRSPAVRWVDKNGLNKKGELLFEVLNRDLFVDLWSQEKNNRIKKNYNYLSRNFRGNNPYFKKNNTNKKNFVYELKRGPIVDEYFHRHFAMSNQKH